MNNKIKIGLIGVGYWGKNILRNIISSDKTEIACVCDNDVDLARERLETHGLLGKVKIYNDVSEFMKRGDVDAVAIATPAGTHYELSKISLENNKHVLVEKPMCFSPHESESLIKMAERKNLTLMCDHTFCFAGTTKAVKQIVENGELGNIVSINSTRLNLGLFQKDTNVIWDLAPHDLSILQYILSDFKIDTQNVQTTKTLVSDHAAEAHIFLKLKSGIQATIHNSWISPVKERKLTIVGDKKMLVWNDLSDEKILVFDKNARIVDGKIQYYDNGYEVRNFSQTEPLLSMINHFAECVSTGEEPLSSGKKSHQITTILSNINE